MLRHKKIRVSLSSVRYFLLAISPILHMYRFISIVTWGEVALVLAILLPCASMTYHCNNLVKKSVITICIYFGIVTVIAGVGISEDFVNSLKEYFVFLVYYIIAFMLINRTDYKQFLQIYKNIAIFTGMFVIIQFVSYTVLGKYISGLVPNVTTYAGVSSNYYISRAMNRSAGFFTEPAMCSRYLSIPFMLCINKLSESDKKFLDVPTLILSCALLFTMAGNGIVALIIGYSIYTYRCIKKRNAPGMLRLIVLISLLAVSFIFLNRIPMFNRMFSRINELSGDSSMKSGYIRVVRGFVAYFNLPILAKIFGIGFGNYITVINNYIYDIMTADTDMILYWINGIQDYFIYGGIIGVFFFTKLLFHSWQNGARCQRTILMLFVAYLFLAGMFTEPLWVIFMVVLFGNDFDKSEEDNCDICNYTNA